MGLFLDGQPFSLGWTSRMYRWHKGLRQSIFLIAEIYASDPSLQCGIPSVTQSSRRDAMHRRNAVIPARRSASSLRIETGGFGLDSLPRRHAPETSGLI
jgi:hypothetical protein